MDAGGTEDGILRGCIYVLTIGFTGLTLPLHQELELRAAADADRLTPHARERMHLLWAQVRDMARLAVCALLRVFRRLPIVLYVPFPGIVDYAEFLHADAEVEAEQVVDPERVRDLATMVSQIKMMGYHLNIFSSESTTLLLERLSQHTEMANRLTMVDSQPFDPDLDPNGIGVLPDFFLPLDQTWFGLQHG